MSVSPKGTPPVVPGFESRFERVGGINLHYWIGGPLEGTPVLLWHGFLGTAFAWRKVMVSLAQAGFSVLAPDMRGYGDSDKPAGVDGYDGRALAQEFRELVRQIGFGSGRPLLVAAHDMGAPPALLLAADYPDEVAALLYMEVPVMVGEVLRPMFEYTPENGRKGFKWWWILPLAPGVPEQLIVGKEREFLTGFYGRAAAKRDAIEAATVDEYLRTFSGVEGVLGALGVYRAAFTTIAQTEPLLRKKTKVPTVALGGEKAQAEEVGKAVSLVAENVQSRVLKGCGHFLPEECSEEIVREIRALANQI